MCCKPVTDLSVILGGVRRWGTLGDVFGPVEHITGTSDRSPATLPELARQYAFDGLSIGTRPPPTANSAARRDVMIRTMPYGDLRAAGALDAKCRPFNHLRSGRRPARRQ